MSITTLPGTVHPAPRSAALAERVTQGDNATPQLAPWVPANRALHLIDIENLVGRDLRSADLAEFAWAALQYLLRVPLGDTDHLIVACNPANAIAAHQALPHARLVVGHGRDGADLALLGAVAWEEIPAHYQRVIVGSGDGIFTDRVAELVRAGVVVNVVGLQGTISTRLGRAATRVTGIPRSNWRPVSPSLPRSPEANRSAHGVLDTRPKVA